MNPLNRYVTVVAGAGVWLLALAVAHGTYSGELPDQAMIWFFALALVVAECLPMRVVHDASEGEITMSSTFALALLFSGGVTTAMIAIAVGAICSDALRRKPPSRMAFNVGQYVLTVGTSALVVSHLSGTTVWETHALTPDLLPAFALAALVFFVVNSMLVARAVTLAEGVRFWPYLRRDVALQSSTVGILLGLAPIVIITAQFSLAALPLLGLPLFAVYGAGRLAIANQRQAQHDSLTGLPNRALLEERLNQALRMSHMGENGVTVMLIDLDRFKEINDTLGHQEGDRVLQIVAERLGPAVREGDTVARFGGDEFVIVLRDVSSEEDVAALAVKLANVIEEPLVVGERVLQVGASIGAARYPQDGDDPETLLRRADVAMYCAKGARERFRIYASAEDPHSTQRLQLAADLHRAVRSGGLLAHFQPKVSLRDGRIEGMEVLMRWPHPERGMISPSEFIPLAEDCGLIGPVTTQALEAAMRECCAWRKEGIEIPFAVNVSARSLGDGRLVDEIRELLRTWKLPGEALQLELTESLLLDEPAVAQEVLRPLREMGVSLAIDDFGTGWSSLGKLSELPFDELKIDRSFVMRMQPGLPEDAIVRSTIQLARDLGLRVVAEGVETEDVLARLVDAGCDAVQGFLLARPAPAEELVRHRYSPAPSAPGRGAMRSVAA